MPATRLHKATIDDLAALVELEFNAFSGDRISRRSWRELLTSPSAIVMVAVDGAMLVGSYVLLLNVRTSIARLYSIAVAREARRQGIAQLLLENALAKAAENGASRLRLETRVDNTGAQQLFERLGFEAFGRAPEYYDDGSEAIRYQRPVMSDQSAPANFSR